jgi:hypothetical protein
MEIKVKSNFADFEKAITHVPTDAKRQFAVGLSRIAKEGRDAARADFARNYIQRSPYMAQGIVYFGAKPDRLEASVGTINYLMALHLFGGTKTGNVAVRGIRGDDKRGKVPRSMTVEKLQAKAASTTKAGKGQSHKFFEKKVNGRTYLMMKAGEKQPRVRKRAGYTGGVYPREPIVPMWLLRDGQPIKVKADWDLEKVVNRTMESRAPAILAAVIEDAWNHAVERGRVLG